MSVIIGTYNGARYIREQLESVLHQTYPPLEILVSDDRSTDNTLDIVNDYSDGQIPVFVHGNDRTLGFADNFLSAVARATGEYIAFCDQDDVWFPNKLARQVAVLNRTGAAAATHDTAYIDENSNRLPHRGSRTGRRLRVLHEEELPPWGNFLGNTVVIRRALLMALPFQARGRGPLDKEDVISHDRWAYALAAMSDGIALIPEQLSAYRQHSAQLYGVQLSRSPTAKYRSLQQLAATAERLEDLARFREDLTRRGAPAQNAERSRRRWTRVARTYARSSKLYTARPSRRFIRLALNAIHGDFLPTRYGGLGHHHLLLELKALLLR